MIFFFLLILILHFSLIDELVDMRSFLVEILLLKLSSFSFSLTTGQTIPSTALSTSFLLSLQLFISFAWIFFFSSVDIFSQALISAIRCSLLLLYKAAMTSSRMNSSSKINTFEFSKAYNLIYGLVFVNCFGLM